MEEEEFVIRNRDVIETETEIDLSIPIEKVLTFLRSRRTVGKLIFDLSEGSIQKAALIQRTKIDEKRREATRKAAGV